MNYKSYDDLSEDIKRGLPKIHAGNYDLIVGIPRSGMIPAYMIGLYLNLNVIDFDSYLSNGRITQGRTRKSRRLIERAHDALNVLLVDDSINSGQSIERATAKLPEGLKDRITIMAVYSNRVGRSDIDFYLEVIPAPRAFEWNIFHRELLAKACVDIDGVLCVDPKPVQNDDGERYIDFISNAKPLLLPSYRIHSLVTNRLEKYREPTERWLKTHGIEYDNLIMLDLPSKSERQRLGVHSTHKAEYFKNQKSLDIFIESDLGQAKEIVTLASKPVYCVDNNLMLKPGVADLLIKNRHYLRANLRSRLISLLPNSFKRTLLNIRNALRGY